MLVSELKILKRSVELVSRMQMSHVLFCSCLALRYAYLACLDCGTDVSLASLGRCVSCLVLQQAGCSDSQAEAMLTITKEVLQVKGAGSVWSKQRHHVAAGSTSTPIPGADQLTVSSPVQRLGPTNGQQRCFWVPKQAR